MIQANVSGIAGAGAEETVVAAEDRRGAYRVSTVHDCVIANVANGESLPARLVDISLLGARIECDQPLDVGTDVQVRLTSPVETSISARIVRELPNHNGPPCYGMTLVQSWPLELFYSLAFPDQVLSPSVPSSTPFPGVSLFGYSLRRPIGKGGSGEVFEALAPGGFLKAIKRVRIDPRSALSIREVIAFRHVRAIRHPYLVSIDRVSIEDNHLIVVMELAEGSLRDEFDSCVAKGLPGIPREKLLGQLREVAEVLDLINEKYGVQHLDIKPTNLFLLAGHMKIGDFGLMRETASRVIGPEMNAVTPWYAAPELFDGGVSRSSDQYSLAVVYVEMLTGKRPFPGSDARQVIFQLATGAGPALSSLPEVDRPAIARALNRDPHQRFHSCAELIEALSGLPGTLYVPAGFTTAADKPDQAATVLVNKIGMTFAHIPRGEFLMGAADEDEHASPDEKPKRSMEIETPFLMSIVTVTQDMYQHVMDERPSGFAATGRYAAAVPGIDTSRFPVEHVSWYQAVAFCNRLSEMDGRTPYYSIDGGDVRALGGNGYRLPTEAEWEYACRAGETGPWCFGNDLALLDSFASYKKDKAYRPSPVGTRRANAWGLHDMHGNVHEWCWDWYDPAAYFRATSAETLPPPPEERRILRGGSFYDLAPRTRSSARYHGRPWDKGGNVGFRVVASQSD